MLLSTAYAENPSWTEVNIVAIISLAVAIASIGELQFNAKGCFFQIGGILAEAARLVLTNSLMKELKLDPLSTLYYIAPCSLVFVGSACLVFEAPSLPLDRLFTASFLSVLIINGLVAFTLNIAVVMLIGKTSALVLTLAGVIKDVFLVFLSMCIFGAPVTALQFLAYAVALLGLNLHKEFKKNTASFAPQLNNPLPVATTAVKA